jgi:phosphohistidine phosphatase
MDLWLIRHGEAVPESENPSRPLSEAGIRKIAAAAEAVAAETGPIGLIASSPKLRARQTAGILAAATGYPERTIVETDALSPGARPEAFLAFLQDHADESVVLCTGHLPSLGDFASYLLSPGDPVTLRFEPGTCCRLRLRDIARGGGELLLLQ